jgi:hypothetical protein
MPTSIASPQFPHRNMCFWKLSLPTYALSAWAGPQVWQEM